jgi:acyl-CoA reductase-like NAD-dependent aldehyde dehydrogenase
VTTAQSAAVGAVLTSHPRARKISFTGSTNIGKTLL